MTIQRALTDAELSQISKAGDELSNDMFHFSLQQRTLVNTGESLPHDRTTVSLAGNPMPITDRSERMQAQREQEDRNKGYSNPPESARPKPLNQAPSPKPKPSAGRKPPKPAWMSLPQDHAAAHPLNRTDDIPPDPAPPWVQAGPKKSKPATAQPLNQTDDKIDAHKDASGSTKHHGKGLQVMGRQNRVDHGPGGKNRTGEDAGQDNTKYGVREPIWHGDRAPRFKNVEDDDPDFQSISGDQMGRNEAEDTQGKPNHGADWKTGDWGSSGGSLPLHGKGRRPSLSEPGYHGAKRDPLSDRKTQAHPIFDRALVAKAILEVLEAER